MKKIPQQDKKPLLVFLVGPTACGKSEIAVHLAKRLNAEVIGCDSMQVYRRMGIITSAPRTGLRKLVKHHLVSFLPPAKEYSVWQYRLDALSKIKAVIEKKHIPLLVGGTGLYITVLIDGIFKAGAENKKLRQRLYKQALEFGSSAMHERLKKVDPRAAGKIHPNDTRRIVRALEVFEAEGLPISQLQKQRRGLSGDYDLEIFCLDMERGALYNRIDRRVDQMFSQGLVRQAKRLLKSKLSKTAGFAIGLREVKGYLDGAYDLEEAKRLIKRNSRQYAKRQLTWFRKDKRIRWIEVREKESPQLIARRIISLAGLEKN